MADLWEEICHLICQVLVITVGIYKKLPFAILWGVDLPVDCHMICQVSDPTVGICKKLPFVILWGVDLPENFFPHDALHIGGRSATWLAKFEHTLHFMFCFTEIFSTKDQ